MNLYYNVVDNYLQIFNNNGKYLFSIKCKNGESILILLEDYLEKNNIELVFDQLIPLWNEKVLYNKKRRSKKHFDVNRNVI